MRYFNQKVYRKTYLLEFYSQKDFDAVAFSVPSTSEDFEFPQRIGETKTFGGTIIEDYGNDIGKLTILGSTVNNGLRLIYQGKKGLAIRNGEEEIFYIKNLIEKYGKRENLIGKKVFLYALNGINRVSNKSWQVHITNFRIKRSKDKPMAYEYTLSCSLKHLQIESKYKLGSITDCMNAINGFLAGMYAGVDFLETGLLYYRAGLNAINNLKNAVQVFEEVCQGYTDTINGYINSTAEYITETVGFVDQVIKSAERIALDQTSQMWDSVQNVNKSARELVDYVRNFPENDISVDLLNQFKTTTADMKNTWIEESDDVQVDAEALVTVVKTLVDVFTPLIVPGDDETDDAILLANGYTVITVSDGDTWDSLAEKYLGDASLGKTLALYNGINSDELEAGTTIIIPRLASSDSTADNGVENPYGEHDNMGKDVDTDFDESQGDLATTSSDDNLDQQINNRLQTQLDSRIRLELYGIRANIGDDDTSLAFLYSSITQTLIADPRIKSVDSITVEGEGNSVTITIEYTDIDGNQKSYSNTY